MARPPVLPVRHAAAAAAGFSVIELLVTLSLSVMVLLVVLQLFDKNSRIARVQTDVAEMQQSLRIAQLEMVRLTRMAGRGGLPVGNLPDGVAVSVTNNVAEGTFIDGPEERHPVLAGTDILTLRGAFSTPVYTLLPETFEVDLDAGTGLLELSSEALPGIPVPQDLGPLARAVADGVPEALILVSRADDQFFQVVELDPASSVVGGDFARVAFRIWGGTHTDAYWELAGSQWRPEMSENAAMVAILEEHRFYVRSGWAVADDPTSAPKPSLVRARVFPNTQVPYRDLDESWEVKVADNVFDLQIALGIDTAPGDPPQPPNGQVIDLGNAADEWLFNHEDDDPTETRWVGDATNPARLYYVRINTVVLTQRPDLRFRAVALQRLEDRVYTFDADDPLHGPGRPPFRRRNLRTVVDLRNVS